MDIYRKSLNADGIFGTWSTEGDIKEEDMFSGCIILVIDCKAYFECEGYLMDASSSPIINCLICFINY